ncbi:MAG: bifunctional 4-hydroxy-2-oxoglutarate aldolase/2-dehydro-3-deoxy-phosphogluconate aldolase [Cyclobacteriaceae bacterium]|nr:bifunctional 4-hydroxy-2-oxoglutarate aldolase/2-dehydro-3-deoxy-phosphogluconate aldolase [Cyclobacteriaceae bacterium]
MNGSFSGKGGHCPDHVKIQNVIGKKEAGSDVCTMGTLEKIKEHKIIAILRGAAPGDVPRIASALYDGGIRLMEVTLNSERPLEAIQALRQTWDGRMSIGAGTVLSVAEAVQAVEAGAEFVISPVLDVQVVRQVKAMGAVSIPGAFTPTEILQAKQAGADIIKVFPANMGPGYLKNLLGPFDGFPLMPTGGVGLDNIKDYQRAGAVAFGVGATLIDTSRTIDAGFLNELTDLAARYVRAVQS